MLLPLYEFVPLILGLLAVALRRARGSCSSGSAPSGSSRRC